MEFVGRRVKKEFEGHGTFFGAVQSFQPNTGFFRIVYEDGDSEELEFSEVALLLVPLEPLRQLSPQQLESSARKRGRQPKKRRITDGGKSDDNSVIHGDVCGDLGGRGGGSSKLIVNLNEGLDLNGGGLSCLNNDDHGRNEVGDGAKLHGLDLNEGLDMELDVGIDINEEFIKKTSGANKGLIDLNLDVNEDFENLSTEREGELFDLNLQLVEDDGSNLDDHVGNTRAHEMVCTERDAQIRKELVENANMGFSENGDGDMRNVDLCKEQEEVNLLKANGVDNENAAARSSQRKKRGRKRKDASNNKTEVATPEIVKVDGETGILNSELENREQTPLNGCHSIDCDNGNSVRTSRGGRGRRRKDLSDNNIALLTSEMGLRRSSRRAKMDALYDQDHVFNTLGLDGNNFQLSSPAVSFVFGEKIMVSGPENYRGHILPPKVELPVPSCNLDLSGVSIFDFLSVYAFLRSFSTLLFLSPFELDGFVASVKSNDSTSLFDSIHVSLLKTLRKHLVALSDEGSVSASKCLRSLNWDFLDLITWPIFVVEYLLLHSPGYIPGLDLCHLKLCQRDYYKLPVSAKVEIMRNLCDDVIEVDAFRSEINRRTLVTEQHMDFDRNTKLESSRKRKSMMDVASTSCITEEDADEPTDWNSDECYLCKMDGNLICCDGCPAAFHPRCVGVVSSLLPEGDWYCPECAIDKDKPWMRVEKSIRGAELLGMDPYGRLYYSSCGYLLVLESCNDQYSFWFYDRDNLPPLIEALESPPFLYDTIINYICKQWNIVREVDGTRNYLDIRSYSIKSAFPNKRRLLDIHPTTSETQDKYKVDTEKKSDEKSVVTTYFSNIDLEIAERDNVVQGTENHTVKVENRLESSEGSAEVSQAFIIDVSKEGGLDCLRICTEISPESQIPGNLANAGDHFTISSTLVTRRRKNPISAKYGNAQTSINNREIISQVHSWTKYVNCYEFARIASSVFEDLISKSSDGTSAPKSVEGIIAGQLKIVSNRSAEFYWSNIHNSVVKSMKEKCGWCFYCKVPEEERDCLFIMNESFPAVENFKSETFGIQSGNDRKNHFVDIMCHIICMEDHLHGLLLGPWLNPHYSVLWRECVLVATNITSLKNLLLKVESNLNHLALSTGWRQNVDTVATMGSASHIVMSSSRVSSKHGIRRKRAKSSEPQITPSSNAMTGLTLLWWRGGRGSRGLFNWKVLPHSLVSKASRQGGCKKITGILYPEVGEYAKRTKCDAWRAAVETSRSVEQLALQVRELDANIRWDDIGRNNLLSKMDKESKKSARSFKKVIIRRKCSEGTVVRYLLDFGKRRFIPEIVLRHGTMIEDSSSERKKYWLEESHIPLYLLKNFEEKRISRKSNKMSSAKLCESSRVIRKPLEERGFSYLFSRAERLDNYQCQHCNKDVLIREAVSCQYCKGFFHKRHARKSFGYITDDTTYTCHKCLDLVFVKSCATEGKSWLSKPTNAFKQLKLVQSGKRKGKPQVKSKKSKRAPLIITLRRSARNAERMSKLSSQKTKVRKGKKKKKHAKSQKDDLKKLNNGCWQKKRTPINSSYWSNGLLLSRKPDDERLTQFRNKMLLVLAGEVASNNDKPKCSLCCEVEYAPNLAYVACEICGVWFHGDALDLTADKILNLMGFKCHKCLNRTHPACPYNFPPGINSTELMPENNAEMGCAEEDYKDFPLSYNRPEDLNFRSDDGVNNASLNLVLEQQSPGLMPESDQKKKDLALDENILQSNGSVEERKQEVFKAVETESAISVSDLVDKEAEFSPLTNNLVENSLTNNKLESVASEPLFNSHELSQKQSGDIVYVGRGKRR